MNHTIAFCIFEFVRVPNFSLNTVLIFGPNLPKNGISGLKQKK